MKTEPFATGLTASSITDMLIRIDLTLDQVAEIDRAEAGYFFGEILRASRLGFHRIIFPRFLADWIIQNLPLSEIDSSHLRRLRSEYTQLAGQIEQAPIFLSVVRGGDFRVPEVGRGLIVGLELLVRGRYLQNSALLLENAVNDGQFFDLIIQHEVKRITFGKVSYELFNGGGATTAAELERLVATQRIVTCICDTDLKVPGGSKSSTYNTMMHKASSIPLIGYAMGTPCSEAENFIPLKVLEILYGNSHFDSCNFLASVMARQGSCEGSDCFWMHFDFKNGWASVLPHLNTDAKLDWACRKLGVSKGDLSGITLNGFGNGIIPTFLSHDAAQAEFFRFTRSQYWILNFSDWLARLLWVICGRAELRTG